MKGFRNYGKMAELLNQFVSEINIYCKSFEFQDMYKYAEEALMPILDIAFDQKFHLMEKLNYPAIDLGSNDKKLSVQITGNNSTNEKIKRTIVNFIKHKQNEKYQSLKILFLQSELSVTLSKNALNKYIKSELPESKITVNDIGFDLHSDVMCITDLGNLIKRKENLHEAVIEILNDQLDYLRNVNEGKRFSELKWLNEELRNLNVLDALCELSKKFEGFPIPRDFKTNLYPFYIQKGIPRFKGNTCLTDNNELFQFLKDIDIVDKKLEYVGNVEEIKSDEKVSIKIKESLEFLAKNYIYAVRCKGVEIDLRNYYIPKRDSFYYAYFRMDLKTSLNSIDQNISCGEENIDKCLKQAFIYFELGLYKKSYDVLISLSEFSKKQNKLIVHFVCEYNLRMLWKYLHRYYYENEEIIKRCENVDLNYMIWEFQKREAKKEIIGILCWIRDEKYINKKREEISNILDIAKKNYKRDQQGELLYPSFPSLLIRLSDFAKEFFKINENYFFLNTHNDDFKSIISNLIEAIIATYQLSNKNIRIKSLPQNYIDVIFRYSDFKKLKQIFSRYKVKDIDIQGNNPKGNLYFLYHLKNLANSKVTIRKYFIKENSQEHSIHFDNLTKYVNNGIILVHYLNLSKDEFNKALTYLLQILSLKEAHYSLEDTYNYLFDLIDDKKDIVSNKNLESLVKLRDKLPKKSPEFNFDFYNLYHLTKFKKQKEIFIKEKIQYYKDHKDCEHTDYYEIYKFLNFCNKTQKKKFIQAIKNKLGSRYNNRIFHSFSLNGHIQYKEYEKVFLETLVRNLNQKDIMFRQSLVYYKDWLDEFVNLAYQNKLNLNLVKYKKIKMLFQEQLVSFPELVNYCEFLFDPKNFDYKKFDAKWLLKNSYWRMQKLSKIKTVKEALLKNINENDNKELALLYVNYFVKSSKR